MKILLVHGEGLGNIIEVLPLLDVLDRTYGTVDVALASASFGFSPKVFIGRKVYLPGETVPDEYDGKIVTIWGSVHGKGILPKTKVMNKIERQQMRLDQSEVDVYLNAARDLGIPEEEFRFDCGRLVGHYDTDKTFDVLLSNGYNWKVGDLWAAKSYYHYEVLAEKLVEKGYRVGSIGTEGEAVKGTEDCTGIGLLETLGLIWRCRSMVSNDTGLYHCAAAMKKPVVVMFTFTSVTKNYDKRFHETAVPLFRNDLSCRPGCHAHMTWRGCKHQSCRDFPVDEVVKKVEAIMSPKGWE